VELLHIEPNEQWIQQVNAVGEPTEWQCESSREELLEERTLVGQNE